jgi:hypothetical protein
MMTDWIETPTSCEPPLESEIVMVQRPTATAATENDVPPLLWTVTIPPQSSVSLKVPWYPFSLTMIDAVWLGLIEMLDGDTTRPDEPTGRGAGIGTGGAAPQPASIPTAQSVAAHSEIAAAIRTPDEAAYVGVIAAHSITENLYQR